MVPSRFRHRTLPLADALHPPTPNPHLSELGAAAAQSRNGMSFAGSLAGGSSLPLPRARRQAGHGQRLRGCRGRQSRPTTHFARPCLTGSRPASSAACIAPIDAGLTDRTPQPLIVYDERKLCVVVPHSLAREARCAPPVASLPAWRTIGIEPWCAIQTYRRLIPRRKTSLSLHPSTKGRFAAPLDPTRRAWRLTSPPAPNHV